MWTLSTKTMDRTCNSVSLTTVLQTTACIFLSGARQKHLLRWEKPGSSQDTRKQPPPPNLKATEMHSTSQECTQAHASVAGELSNSARGKLSVSTMNQHTHSACMGALVQLDTVMHCTCVSVLLGIDRGAAGALQERFGSISEI